MLSSDPGLMSLVLNTAQVTHTRLKREINSHFNQ